MAENAAAADPPPAEEAASPAPAPSASEETGAAAAEGGPETSEAQDPPSSEAVPAPAAEEGAEAEAQLEDDAEEEEEAGAGGAPAVVAQQLPLNMRDVAHLGDADAADALDNEFLSLLPPSILPRVERLKVLNSKRDEILEEYRVERAALELKFGKMMSPLYEERRGVVNGELDEAIKKDAAKNDGDGGDDVVAEEGVVEDVSDEEGEDAAAAGEQDIRGIPQFWACAMGHVDVIAELITEADVDCLDHLTEVTCADFPDGLGFELIFHFSPNAFFSNTTLTKRYEVPNLLTEDEPILKSVTGTEIKWKAGQSLATRDVTKKQRKKGGRGAGQIRTIKKKERTESFFHFFTPPKMPALAEVMDEEEADAVEEAFDHDYDVAQAFRGHLIPKAVLWFTGEAMDDDYDEDMLEEMMAGEEGDDDDSEGGGGPQGGGGQQQQFAFNPEGGDNPFPPPAAGDGENPECKQN